jgi:hypothetical protein
MPLVGARQSIGTNELASRETLPLRCSLCGEADNGVMTKHDDHTFAHAFGCPPDPEPARDEDLGKTWRAS